MRLQRPLRGERASGARERLFFAELDGNEVLARCFMLARPLAGGTVARKPDEMLLDYFHLGATLFVMVLNIFFFFRKNHIILFDTRIYIVLN